MVHLHGHTVLSSDDNDGHGQDILEDPRTPTRQEIGLPSSSSSPGTPLALTVQRTITRRLFHDLPSSSPVPPSPLSLGIQHTSPLTALTASQRDDPMLSPLNTDFIISRAIASTGLFGLSYDNINMMFRAAEQVLGRGDSQENGTCSTLFPLWKARIEDMQVADLTAAFLAAPPLALADIMLSRWDMNVLDRCLRHCLLRILLEHGGPRFQRFHAALETALPVTSDQIDIHKTDLYPQPAWNIDESTITGNADFVDAAYTELDIINKPGWLTWIKLLFGDQLSIARLRSLVNIRAGHEGGFAGFSWGVWVPGLFHVKIADVHGFLTTHWGTPNRGTRNPGCLAFHNTVLNRSPILLTSLPPFRTCRDLIFVSLYARVAHCFLRVSGKASLDEYADSVDGINTLIAHAERVQLEFANANVVSNLRWQRRQATADAVPSAGDEIFENACLFLRDALLTRELTDSVKAGDSGRVMLVLKAMAFGFRGNGRSKYAYEMLHLIHNMTHVWPKPMRKIVLNNWILFPSGNPNSGVEADLMQEHMNYWIKTFYQAHGSSASWEWLEMIAPCVGVLRDLARMMRDSLGSNTGTRHAPSNLSLDIATLMKSLADHGVYEIKGRRFAEEDGAPVPDVVAVGIQQLSVGTKNPLREYNLAFARLQARRRLQPIIGEGDCVIQSTQSEVVDVDMEVVNEDVDEADPITVSFSTIEDLSDFERAILDDEPTLTLETAADVSLDMDSGDNGFIFDDNEDEADDEEELEEQEEPDPEVD